MTLIVQGNFSVEALEESLLFWLERAHLDVAVSIGGYNQLLPALFESKTFVASATDPKLLVFSPDGLSGLAEGSSQLGISVDSIVERVRQLSAASKAPVVVAITHAFEASALGVRLVRAVAEIAGVELISPEHIQVALGDLKPEQLMGSLDADIPFAREYWAALAGIVVRTFHQRLVPTRKVLVLDCDNTLWRGVLGEDGVNGIKQDSAHRALVRKAQALVKQGWLLCLASKNEQTDVQQVFEQRDFGLRWQDFAAWRINWEAKPCNLRGLAEELNLGLDALVFVDDSPLECELMRAALPEVVTLRFDQQAATDWLDEVWVFDGNPVATQEDQSRTAFYQSDRQRTALRNQAASNADYLTALEMQLTVSPAEPSQFDRIAQLSQRTNQFNVSGARLERSEVARVAQQQVVLQASLRDRFGDYGLVGAVLAEQQADRLRIIGFYLSCRAFGRGVEHQLLQQLSEHAAAKQIPLMEFAVKVLPRNLPALQFIAQLTDRAVDQIQAGLIQYPTELAQRFGFNPQAMIANEKERAEQRSSQGPSQGSVAAADYQALAAVRAPTDILAQIDAVTRARPDLATPFVAPRQGVQQRLAQLWRSALRLDQVGANDEFNDLGGRSIQLVGLHQRIVTELGFPIVLMDLFRFTTIAKLARFLQQDAVQHQLAGAAQRSQKMRQSLHQFRSTRRLS